MTPLFHYFFNNSLKLTITLFSYFTTYSIRLANIIYTQSSNLTNYSLPYTDNQTIATNALVSKLGGLQFYRLSINRSIYIIFYKLYLLARNLNASSPPSITSQISVLISFSSIVPLYS